MSDNEITPSSSKIAEYFAKALGNTVEQIDGLLADKLRFVRWEKQLKLVDRCKEIAQKRAIEGKETPIPLKSLVPLIESASIESEPELEELWAQLLVSFLDPGQPVVRSGYVQMLKQLEPIDAQILSICYKSSQKGDASPLHVKPGETEMFIDSSEILEQVEIERLIYESSIDNLVRTGCLSHYVKKDRVRLDLDAQQNFGVSSAIIDKNVVSISEYTTVRMTALGVGFAKACGM